MLFWGWGTSRAIRQISPTQAVVLAYRYFHLMFVFTLTHHYTYLLATGTEQGWAHREISKEEALHLLGGAALEPSLWKRYSLYGLLALIGVLVLVSLLFSTLRRR